MLRRLLCVLGVLAGSLVASGAGSAADEAKPLTPHRQHEEACPIAPDHRPGTIDPRLLRGLAEGGSSDWLAKDRRKDIEEILRQLPPKHRQMVKEYFEKLEKMQKDKK